MNKETIKKLRFLNNIIFYGAVGFSLYVLIKTYMDRAKLPEGVCPINNNQSIFYLAIGLLVLTFIFSLFLDSAWKKLKNGETAVMNQTERSIMEAPEDIATEDIVAEDITPEDIVSEDIAADEDDEVQDH